MVWFVLGLGALSLAVAAAAAWRLGAGARVAAVALAVGIGVMGGGSWQRLQTEDPARRDLRAVEYRRSVSCRKCHAAQYDSWYDTFHRTMTQEASPDAVLGDFDDVELEYMGHPCRLYRRDDSFYMELVDWGWEQDQVARGLDPAADPDPPRREYRVDRLVGSHELQVYLYRTPDGRYITLPLEWNQRERRWVTAAGNYLQPPREIPSLFAHVATWNQTCIFCHNTRPNPAALADSLVQTTGEVFRSEFEELGIACEACHGPGDAHEAANRDPLRRHALQRSDRPDPTIVHPERLDQAASLDLCGRCHGKWGAREEFRDQVFRSGDRFVPGHDPLTDHYIDPTERAGGVYDETMSGYFWPDGSPRPTAMEYQGVKLSPCATRGPMTCLSCHSMHDADPDDQLRFPDDPATADFEDDEACLQCHDAYRAAEFRVAHTHHEATSEGSRCVNCHMPFTTFGLMKTVRSHRVVDPDAGLTAWSRLPNGCNQCHVDRNLAWTDRWLSEWYGQPASGQPDDDPAQTVVDLLQGHALSRAIAAYALGWKPGRVAAPGDWRVPLLLAAMDDEYAAVRLNAWLSLRDSWGLPPDGFDYLAGPQERRAWIRGLEERWRSRRRNGLPPGVLVGPDGLASTALRLRETRDRIPLTILE